PVKEAQFDWPFGLTADAAGNLYVFDQNNFRIRHISPDGIVSTLAGTGEPGFADGPADQAQFLGRGFLAVDAAGNVYAGDGHNHRIRLITPAGTVSTLAGTGESGYRDGPADQAQFNNPVGVAVDANGNVYVADTGNNRVRLITSVGMVSTLAGSGEPGYKDGSAKEAQFDAPLSLTVDVAGNVVVGEGFVPEMRGTNRLRLITPDGMVTTLAGSGKPGHKDGPAAEARFVAPSSPTFDAGGNLLVSDEANYRVRLVTSDGIVYTLAGSGERGRADGPGPQAQFGSPYGLSVGPTGEAYVADFVGNTIRRVTYGNPAAATPLPTDTPPQDERIIKIGYSFVYAGARGVEEARMAVDEANASGGVTVDGASHSLQLVIAPACCRDEGVVFGAEWLVEQGVVAVVAPLLVQGYLPQSPVYSAAGLVQVTPGGQDPRFTLEGPSTAYRVGPNVAYGGPVAARFVYEELGIRRAALLPETADFPQTAADALQKAFEALGGEVYRHDVTPESLADSMAAIREERAEAVLIFLPTPAFVDSLIQHVRETGLPVPIIGYIVGRRISPGVAPEGMYDVQPGRPTAAMPGFADFVTKHRAANLLLEPNQWDALAYDATNVIIEAIHRAAETGAVTRESVAAAMETFRDEPYQG
ncbi:MAG: ABC transporter substrate-binding protein, partial [Anaerolineae bacterium]